MRAKEFTINVPINIKINGDGDPEISTGQDDTDQSELDQNPIMVPPLQQQLELAKAGQGKNSPVIDKLTADHSVGEEPSSEDNTYEEIMDKIKQLISR